MIGFDNQIGEKGAAGIAEGISKLKNLINLQFTIDSCNYIGSQGATSIGEGLKNCSSL